MFILPKEKEDFGEGLPQGDDPTDDWSKVIDQIPKPNKGEKT